MALMEIDGLPIKNGGLITKGYIYMDCPWDKKTLTYSASSSGVVLNMKPSLAAPFLSFRLRTDGARPKSGHLRTSLPAAGF